MNNEQNCDLNKEMLDLKGEIEFIELYNLTLKSYCKDISNPCKKIFVNKFQTEKLIDEQKRLIVKVCDFDESINTFNIQESCNQSNFNKIKSIFSHFKIN